MAKRYDPERLRRLITDWSKESVSLGGVEVPRWFIVKLGHPDWPTSVLLKVVFDPETGPVASGIAVDEESTASYHDAAALISATAPIDVVLQGATALAAGVRAAHLLRDQLPADVKITDDMIAEHVARRDETASQAWGTVRPRRRRVVTRTFLRQVAAAYNEALTNGNPPTVAVAERFEVSHRTASRWIGEARKIGEIKEGE